MPSPTALVFLKAPQEGLVKTRLAKETGAPFATAAYKAMAERQLRQIPAHWTTCISFAPDDAAPCFKNWMGEDLEYQAQGAGDLGQRLQRAVARHFADKTAPLFLLGSDCPWLTCDLLEQAAAALDQHELVLGPALDGGYYLLGLKADFPELFDAIEWGSGSVLKDTLARAAQRPAKVHLLPTRRDVDTLEDWRWATSEIPELQAAAALHAQDAQPSTLSKNNPT